MPCPPCREFGAQAYFRDDLLEQRRPIMEAWAEYVWPISRSRRSSLWLNLKRE